MMQMDAIQMQMGKLSQEAVQTISMNSVSYHEAKKETDDRSSEPCVDVCLVEDVAFRRSVLNYVLGSRASGVGVIAHG